MVPELHDGMMSRVTDNGAVLEAFAVTNEVKQGCLLVPIIFNLMFSGMLINAYHDERPLHDGQLLTHRRMHFQMQVPTTTVHELLFADDCVLNATSQGDMHGPLCRRLRQLRSGHQHGEDGDVATGARRQGGQVRRYEDTPKTFLKRLQISLTNWKDLDRNRPTWRKTVKTGALINEANCITAAKANREARKSHLSPLRNSYAQPAPTYPHCQRTFRAPLDLVGHNRTNCSNRTTPGAVSSFSSASLFKPTTNIGRSPESPLPSSSSSSSSSTTTTTTTTTTASTSSTAAPVPTTTSHNPDPPTNINRPRPPTTPAMWARSITVLIATVPPPRTSAWSVNCESTAQKLTDQCLEH
ncbi:hypothetical protein SprV_0200577500 [Sparganum proliferum]